MSFIDGALKTSAIVCMTAVTVSLSVATAGGIIYGPKIATSVIGASDEISRTSRSIRGLTNSANESVKIVNYRLGKICDATGVSMKAISESLEKLSIIVGRISEGVENCHFEEDKENVSKLLASITGAVNVITKKVEVVNGISAEEIDGTIKEVHRTFGIINDGLKGFFEESKDGKTKINLKKVIGAIKVFMDILNGDQDVQISNSSQSV